MYGFCREFRVRPGGLARRKSSAICGTSREFWHVEASAWQNSDGNRDTRGPAGLMARANTGRATTTLPFLVSRRKRESKAGAAVMLACRPTRPCPRPRQETLASMGKRNSERIRRPVLQSHAKAEASPPSPGRSPAARLGTRQGGAVELHRRLSVLWPPDL